MIAAQLAKAAHARRHAAKPLQHVEIVQALIQQHAAAFALPGRAPTAAGVIGFGAIPIGDDPTQPHDVAEFAALDQLLDFQITRLGTQLEHAGENQLLVFLMRRNQSLRIGFVRGNRLFDHDMQPALQRRDAQAGVLIMRRGNQHGIHFAGMNQLLAVVINFQRLVLFQLVPARCCKRRRVRSG